MHALGLAPDRRMQAAFWYSLALHALLLMFLPIWGPSPGAELGPVETISFGRIMHVQLARHANAAARPPAAPSIATPQPRQPHVQANVRAPAVSRGPSRRDFKVSGSMQRAAATVAAALPISPGTGVSTSSPDSVAAATSAPAAAEGQPNDADRRSAGGTEPFQVDYPSPVIDESSRAALVRLHANVTLIVKVSDTGKIESIQYDPPDLPADVRKQIEELLAAARWDPAICSGLSCEGTARIRL